jgi:hypothetical protein
MFQCLTALIWNFARFVLSPRILRGSLVVHLKTIQEQGLAPNQAHPSSNGTRNKYLPTCPAGNRAFEY